MKKIFRWLLSHLLLILVIVSVIYSYMFWGNLTGGNTPAGKAVAYLSEKFDGVGNFVEGVKSKQARLSGASSNPQSDSQSGQQSKDQVEQVLAQQIEKQAESVTSALDSTVAVNDTVSSQVETAIEAVKENTDTDENSSTGSVEKMQSANVGSSLEKFIEEKGELKLKQENFEQEKIETLALTEDNIKQNEAEQVASGIEKQVLDVSEEDKSLPTKSQQTKLQQAVETRLTKKQNVAEQSTEQPPVSISYSHNNKRVQQNSDGIIEVYLQDKALTDQDENTAIQKTEDAQVTAVVSDDILETKIEEEKVEEKASNDGFVPAEIVNQLETIDEASGLVTNDLVISDLETGQSKENTSKINVETLPIHEIWITARKSFYQRNYDLSEQSYKLLITKTKDNFDAFGELGNVYFNQGKKEQAAEAYLQAATILLVKGDIQQAQNLLRVIQQLDASKAKQLQRLLDSKLS